MSIVGSTAYAAPGESGSPVELRERYENFTGGQWFAPTTIEYRENLTPSMGEPFCQIAHSGAQDIELALDLAHAAKDDWGSRSGECCDGASPISLKDGELPAGPHDVRLGNFGGPPFCIDSDQYERWGTPRFLIDVGSGAAEGFSLVGLEGVHFISRTP